MRMKSTRFLALLALVCSVLPGLAGTLSGSGSHEALIDAQSIHPFSVGGLYQWLNRDVKAHGKTETLHAHIYEGVFSYDVLPWLSPYFTAGVAENAYFGHVDEDRGDSAFSWSIGMNLNLWQLDVADPEFMAGRLSVGTVGEYGQYAAESSDLEIQWNEILLALPVSYELFVERATSIKQIPYSLLISAGPALSFIDGSHDTPARHANFSEKNSVGILGRLYVFISHNLSVGCQVQYFDETTLDANIAYRFQ